jgi:acetyltransferase
MSAKAATIFNARNVAIVGATDKSHWPPNIFNNLKESGFPGRVFLINPRRDELFGEKCYPDFASLPEPAELAMMIVPAKFIPDMLADGAQRGVKAAIVYAAGMGEGSSPESHALGAALKETIDKHDLAVCGPNCMGLFGAREKMFLYPHRHLSNMEPGSVGMVLHSGGTLSYFVRSAVERGLRFSYAISSGNEAGLAVADYIDMFVDDPHTKQIALYVEGIRKPEAFLAAAGRALAAGKPIFAIKTGRSTGAREGAKSHSGAIAGDYAAWEAVCERYGIVNCASLEDMIETLLAFQQGRLPKGPGVGFVTTSGGAVNMVFDHADMEGTKVPPLSKETADAVSKLVADDVVVRNPIDTGPPMGGNAVQQQLDLCRTFASDPDIHMIGWAALMPGTDRGARDPAEVRAMVDSLDMPVVAFNRIAISVPPGLAEFQDAANLCFLQGMPATMRAMNALWFYGARAGRTVPPLPEPAGRKQDSTGAALTKALAARGIAGPKETLARDAAAAAKAAAEIGFPVALKVVSPQVLHKTEAGGVRLGLRDAAEVEKAVANMTASVKRAVPDAEIAGFLVQEMVSGVEMIVGAHDDPIYGPVLVVGAGGILVELVRDSAVRLLPVSMADADAMIGGLRAKKLLDGFRGQPPCDTDALLRAICDFGAFYLDHRPYLGELEINPLAVLPKGRGVRAIDIRAVPREK